MSKRSADEMLDEDELVSGSGSEVETERSNSGEDFDTEDEEITELNQARHAKKPKKRKRALSPSAFGASLSSLLQAPKPSTAAIQHLHSQATARKAEKSKQAIEDKALKFLQATKHEQQERGHVTDVIGGWIPRPAKPFSEWSNYEDDIDHAQDTMKGGAEAEKALRKLAQRGVVKLFNAIKAAQQTGEDEQQPPAVQVHKKAITNEASTDAAHEPAKLTEELPADKRLPNILGSKGKEQALANMSKDSFLQILKSQSARVGST